MKTVKQTIHDLISQVLEEKYNLGGFEFSVEYPKEKKFGDYSSNVAMLLSKELKNNPLVIAEDIKQEISQTPLQEMFTNIEIASPGFINFYLSDKVLFEYVKEILKRKTGYGVLEMNTQKKIQVEFISANPTGPLTLANGRGGFSGDVLANILKLAGNQVEREYYINDHGNQLHILGHSILKDDKAEYKGDYIDSLHSQLKEANIDIEDIDRVGSWGAKIILEKMIKPAIGKMRINYDCWFSENSLHQDGSIDRLLEYLKEQQLVFENEGAFWLKTKNNEAGDEKDRVLVKSNGDKTYFLADVAYHYNKFHDRNFDKVINLWGADHHGYVPRLKSAMAMLGYPGQLEILLMQMVRLIQDGKEVRMSKRKGVYVLLEDLIDEVGIDVARFFFLMHANNKAMDFDLGLAKEKSNQNPVYYVQYAHARICSIISKAKDQLVDQDVLDLQSAEQSLIKDLIKWPELVGEIAQSYEVHKVAFYAISVADKLHDFYEQCRVVENGKVSIGRLNLIKATQQVLQNVLHCLGVSAPEKM